jgi:hypothetical protein
MLRSMICALGAESGGNFALDALYGERGRRRISKILSSIREARPARRAFLVSVVMLLASTKVGSAERGRRVPSTIRLRRSVL